MKGIERAVRRFFCSASQHVDASGNTFLVYAHEPVPPSYRRDHPAAPDEITHVACKHCGAVTAGMTIKQLLRMNVSPWM